MNHYYQIDYQIDFFIAKHEQEEGRLRNEAMPSRVSTIAFISEVCSRENPIKIKFVTCFKFWTMSCSAGTLVAVILQLLAMFLCLGSSSNTTQPSYGVQTTVTANLTGEPLEVQPL